MDAAGLHSFLKAYTEEEKNALKGIYPDYSDAVLSGYFEGEPYYSHEIVLQNHVMNREDIRRSMTEPFFIVKASRFVPVQLHVHDWVEFHYMYSGNCMENVRGQLFQINKGQILMIDALVPHALLPCNEEDIIIAILVKKQFLNRLLTSHLSQNSYISAFLINSLHRQRNQDSFILFQTQEQVLVHDYICALMCEFYDPSDLHQDIVYSLFTLVICELAKAFERQYQFVASKSTSQIIPILRFIERNFLSCTLTSVAERFHMNSNYLSGLIRSATGSTYKEIVLNHKFQYAGSLLRNTDFTIDAIAREIGYENPSAFYRKFKEIYEVSPSEFRKTKKDFNGVKYTGCHWNGTGS